MDSQRVFQQLVEGGHPACHSATLLRVISLVSHSGDCGHTANAGGERPVLGGQAHKVADLRRHGGRLEIWVETIGYAETLIIFKIWLWAGFHYQSSHHYFPPLTVVASMQRKGEK